MPNFINCDLNCFLKHFKSQKVIKKRRLNGVFFILRLLSIQDILPHKIRN